jgi:hypothetical protein
VTDELRVVCWNIERNGRGRSGGDDHRALARDILASIKPHVVLRQELTGAWDHGKADLYVEANRLGGLTPFMAAPQEGRSRNPVGVMVDPNLFVIDGEFEHDMPWKPICNPRVRLKGCAKPIDLASAHLCHFDPACARRRRGGSPPSPTTPAAPWSGWTPTVTRTARTWNPWRSRTGTRSRTACTTSTAPSSAPADVSRTLDLTRSSPAATRSSPTSACTPPRPSASPARSRLRRA